MLTFDLNSTLDIENERPAVERVMILGGGPAGLAAAIYAARANHAPLLLTGHEIGGQVATTDLVENYPGFVEGVQGAELAREMQAQAERFGARVVYDTITRVNLFERPFHLIGAEREYRSHSLIVATGASATKLNVPGEREFTGRGVSYCATCDGYFFKKKEIVIVGGGDSALEEGLFLTKFASCVTIIHRRDTLRAGAILQKRAREHPRIHFLWNGLVEEILGSQRVEGVRVRNVVNGETQRLLTDGVFIYIGHKPNSNVFEGQLELDAQGYIATDKQMRTNIEGVFAAGEIADPHFRQVITSAGMGAAAAMEAEKYLAEHALSADEAPMLLNV